MSGFKKATKKQSFLRLNLTGPSGAGKTYTGLKLAAQLGQRVAVIDTERGSASKYSDVFEFDVLELETFSPLKYIEAIKDASVAGYDVLVIDSLSHAWMGAGGALELVDRAAKKSQSGNTYMAWRDVTPLHNQLVDAILAAPLHVITTMRAKSEYVIETNERGKSAPKKIGLAAIQRDGMEYEFDVTGMMTLDNELIIEKTRCSALAGMVFTKPGADLAGILKTWLTDGAPRPEPVVDERPGLLERLKAARAEEKEKTGGNSVALTQALVNAMSDDELYQAIQATRQAVQEHQHEAQAGSVQSAA